MAPLRVINTLDLETSSAAVSVVEKSCAERRRVHAIALAVQVAVTTRAAFRAKTEQKMYVMF